VAAVQLEGNRGGGLGSTTPSYRQPKCPRDQLHSWDPLVRWVLAVLWEAESAAELAAESAGVLEMVWVEPWEWSQGELWCSPFPSLSNRTPVGLETK